MSKDLWVKESVAMIISKEGSTVIRKILLTSSCIQYYTILPLLHLHTNETKISRRKNCC
jgi:hypothetical protein